MRANGKHELDRLAQKFAERRAAELIVRPDAANEGSQQAFQQEYGTIWTLRDALLGDVLAGGAPPTIETLDAVEALAKECCRRRVVESLKIAGITNGKAGPAFRFLAESLGVEVDAELTPQIPTNLHG